MTVQSLAVQNVRSQVSTGVIMKETHAAIHARILAVISYMPKRTPQRERAYVRGYGQALLDAIWSDVEFCYRDASGTLFSTHKESTHRMTEEFYSRNEGHLLGGMECAHVWKGTDKLFSSDWSVPNHAHTV